MADEAQPTTETTELEALLSHMPQIAEAVNAFASETVQQQAFEALIASASSAVPSSSKSAAKRRASVEEESPKKRPRKSGSTGAKTPKRTKRAGPQVLKDLDLRPPKKKSLKDFVGEKKPTISYDRNVVSLYYLENELGITPVTLAHIYTCYHEMNWRLPTDFANSLAVTSSQKRYMDTSNMDDIKLTPSGLNRVVHDLPVTKTK